MTAQEHFEEGLARLRADDRAAAAIALEAAVRADPAHREARYHLANAYRDLFRLADAEREIREVVRQGPDDPKAATALGVILQDAGRPAEAVAVYETVMRDHPSYVTAATNWVGAQQYLPGITEARLKEAHARWAALHAPTRSAAPFENDRGADRPLRVGFVSPDLSRHPVGLLSVKLFENIDRAQIRAIVFSTRPQAFEDDISRRIAQRTQWTTVYGLSDSALAALIRGNKIDVLVDMTGHTAHNRLTLFAARAAPVQMSWLGYTGTTGVPAMDYVLATDALAPRGAERFYNERILRLPTHACFDPPRDARPVAPAPAARNGHVTFGCLNNPVKISEETLENFAAILARVPGSRLKLRYKTLDARETRERLISALEGRGVARTRVDIAGHAPGSAFLTTYDDIDIALDTHPYSGCMTTCEALWMGCPVVTFPGATFAGRQSASALAAAGLGELIARDRTSYQDLAVALAADAERCAALRAGLRARLAVSALLDGPAFAREFTAAMKAIWDAWRTENK